jgi:hypothetical protein
LLLGVHASLEENCSQSIRLARVILKPRAIMGTPSQKNETSQVPDEHIQLTADSQDYVVGEMIGFILVQL